MPRTTETKVKAALGENNIDEDIDIYPHIVTAGVLVDRINTRATADSITITATELEVIETYLSAHFYALADPQYVEKQTGKASAVFMGKTDMGLDYTPWGQMAKMLDPTTTLSSVTVGGYWLGKPLTS